MRKTVIAIVIVILLVSIIIPAYAANSKAVIIEPGIETNYNAISAAKAELYFSGTSAKYSGIANAVSNSYTIKIKLRLQKRIDGIWTSFTVDEAQGIGISGAKLSLTRSGCAKGTSYRSYLYVAVYDSNNNYVESAHSYSTVVVC